ncbi:RbtT/DalT/CsbX family MFS transporter [Hoyosella altamirensis]|uniref:Polyol permease family/HAD superfamily hydrolase (TIGR01549 family) n=1 Tax=Hoyosella altamirensis TaxID=616997 RepID=A0A839RIA7_9ACTN|nr:RbtT/DalT/CsbX family MFS transporter [Hoyosella altamirensis]MBB3036532.1 polyol permease family/HAD superfamily hydrolase (TIGR01549 family) [Hoyosella altamirensis]
MTTSLGLPHSGTEPRRSWADRFGMPRALLWGYVGLLIFMIGDGVEAGYLSPFMMDRGLSGEQVALMWTLYGVTVGIAAWLSGALSDLWGPRKVMWLGLGIWAALQVLLLAIAIPTMNFTLILFAFGLRGFGYPLFAYGFLVWIAAATPQRRLGTAVGWFWFAFTGGLPTLGALVAAGMIPLVGEYETLWFALILIILGGLLALLAVKERTGYHRLAPEGEHPVKTLLGSVSILWRNPRIGAGAIVRTINTAPQFGFLVFMPTFFTETIGFTLSEWLRLLTVMFAVNIVFNLIFGVVGDKVGWRTTVCWFGGIGSAVSILLLYYVPVAAGANYALALLVAGLYGATLAGYVPLSALMPSLAPQHKGQAMAALNLGAGASVMVGPAIAGIFLGPLGVQGVMIIFAGMYVFSAILVLFLKLPGETAERPETNGSPVGHLAAMAGGSVLGHPIMLRKPSPEDRVDAIFFDIGGTIYDDDCFAQALLTAVHELNPDVTDADFWAVYDAHRQYAKGSLRTTIAERFVGGRRTELDERARAHWEYPQSSLYSDVLPVLSALAQQYTLGIIANSRENVLDALERDGLRELFTVTTLADQVGAVKPDRRIFQHALLEAGIPADRTVYVGNRLDADIRPAQSLGMRAVWMLRGEAPPAPTERQLSEPDAVISSLTGLPLVLERFAGREPTPPSAVQVHAAAKTEAPR